MPILNNALPFENNKSSFFNPAVTIATNNLVCCFSLYPFPSTYNIYPSTTSITILELLETCPPFPVNTLDTPLMPFCHIHLKANQRKLEIAIT